MKKAIFTIALLLLFAATLQAQEYTLQFKPKKGAEFNYLTSMDISQTINQGGGEMTFGGLITNTMKAGIVKSAKNSNEIRLNFSKAEITTKGMAAFGMGNDTTMPAGLIDQLNVVYKTDSRGRIISAEQTMMDTSDMALEQFVAGLKELTKLFFLVYPEMPLKKGDKWTATVHDTSDRSDGNIVTSSTIDYTFDGITDTLGIKCARIYAKSSSLTVAGSVDVQDMKTTIDGDGVTTSTNYVELSTGMPVVSHMSKDIDTRMMISGQNNFIMPAQTYTRMSISRVK